MVPILLIYCAGWAETSEEIVDHCKYGAPYPYGTRCGDVCLTGNRNCDCGEERLTPGTGPQHCCVDPSPDNITQCSIDSRGDAICPQGRVLDKTETCNGHCYNDYHASEQIGPLSQFRCGDKCVPVWRMCRGYSGCQDSSDVAVCNENLTCVSWRGDTEEKQTLGCFESR